MMIVMMGYVDIVAVETTATRILANVLEHIEDGKEYRQFAKRHALEQHEFH